jgi:hypothetical protein
MKFVSLSQEDPEVDGIEVCQETGEVTASVRLVLSCIDCGTEMKETHLDIQDTPHGLDEHMEMHEKAEEEFSLDVEESNVEATDEYQNLDRHGKPIRSFRYMKHYYGAQMTATVTCSCGESFDVDLSDSVQASFFDELV